MMTNSDATHRTLATHPPGHDSREPRPEGVGTRGSEALPSTAEAGLGAAVHTVTADRAQEMAHNVVIDTP